MKLKLPFFGSIEIKARISKNSDESKKEREIELGHAKIANKDVKTWESKSIKIDKIG